jgi:hypothetical protein
MYRMTLKTVTIFNGTMCTISSKAFLKIVMTFVATLDTEIRQSKRLLSIECGMASTARLFGDGLMYRPLKQKFAL